MCCSVPCASSEGSSPPRKLSTRVATYQPGRSSPSVVIEDAGCPGHLDDRREQLQEYDVACSERRARQPYAMARPTEIPNTIPSHQAGTCAPDRAISSPTVNARPPSVTAPNRSAFQIKPSMPL